MLTLLLYIYREGKVAEEYSWPFQKLSETLSQSQTKIHLMFFFVYFIKFESPTHTAVSKVKYSNAVQFKETQICYMLRNDGKQAKSLFSLSKLLRFYTAEAFM